MEKIGLRTDLSQMDRSMNLELDPYSKCMMGDNYTVRARASVQTFFIFNIIIYLHLKIKS